MKKKLDSIALGAVLGVIAPIITFFVVLKFVYPFEFSDKSLHAFWLQTMTPKILSLAALPNLGTFLLFAYTNRLQTARGILGVTIILAVIVFVTKIF